MPVEIYFDESEKDGCYAIGGFIAPQPVWKQWNIKWHALLKQSPQLGFYRTSDALSLAPTGQFRRFTKEQRDRRLIELAETFPSANCYGVSACFKTADFNEFISAGTNVDGLYKKPYYICAYYLLQKTYWCLTQSNPAPSVVNVFFDSQGSAGKQLQSMMDISREMFKEHEEFPFARTPRHEKKEKCLPLQAADMYVSWVRRIYGNENEDAVSSDVIVEKISAFDFEVERDYLKRVAEVTESLLREQSQ
jgi:hypothetical protein